MGLAGLGWKGPSFASDAAGIWGARRTLLTNGSSAEWLCPARRMVQVAPSVPPNNLVQHHCSPHQFQTLHRPMSIGLFLLVRMSLFFICKPPPLAFKLTFAAKPPSVPQANQSCPPPSLLLKLSWSSLKLCMALASQIASVSNRRIISLFLALCYLACLAESKHLMNVS